MTSIPDDELLQWRQHTCECCLASSQNIFKDVSMEYFCMGMKEVYAEMIFNAFCITINTGDGDHKICDICIKKLREATYFKQQIIESKKTLFERIPEIQVSVGVPKNEIKIEDESLDVSSSINGISDIEDNLDELSTGDAKTAESEVEIPETIDQKQRLRKEVPSSSAQTFEESNQNFARVKRGKIVQTLKKKAEFKESKPEVVRVRKEKIVQPRKNKADLIRMKISNLESDEMEADVKLKELSMKNTTLTLILHSNLTVFDWYKNKYRCFYCKELFLDTDLLKDHVKSHNLKELTHNIQRFNNKYYYRAEISDLQCLDCHQPFNDLNELTKHLMQIHRVAFDTEESLLMPYRLKDSKCQLCNLEFKSFVTLDHHMTTHYSKHMCDTCGKGFRHKSSLKTHINTHTKRNYQCKICDLKFESYYKKHKHDQIAHNVDYDYICPLCPEKFANYVARLWHLVKRHDYEKPDHKCKHCNKTYITNALLNSHVRKVHMQERNYECDVCKNKYMRKCELTDHMKSHIQSRDFVCSFCGKGFFRRRNLNEHLAIHVEEYRHECPVCGKTFAQKYNMNMHRKRCQESKKR